METFAQLPHRRMGEALRPLPQSAIVLLNPSPLMGEGRVRVTAFGAMPLQRRAKTS